MTAEERGYPAGNRERNKDLVLAPGEFAYMQDTNKGTVKVLVGPTVFSPTGQDQPVIYEMRGKRPFQKVGLEEGVQQSAIAVEGYYLTLLNPAGGNKQPEPGSEESRTPDLDVGRKVNIPGPCMFALWPGQTATMLKGHHLRSNQYLLVRVYNEEEATKNWSKAIIKMATDSDGDGDGETTITSGIPGDISLGKQYIIKGTEVSFYIPPTGVSVIADEYGSYIREALTLERLEYTILVDQNGKKRYEIGPSVVFPEPTERYKTDDNENKKFRAYELNDIQGIYIKVIADYVDELTGEEHKAGEELFITGKNTPIYYPREEHCLVKYDNQPKHFATSIPKGEGRYRMGRMTGNIEVVKGPDMVLPDPRTEVFVHRVLTDGECGLWYPGNNEALAYNQSIRPLIAATSSTRGAISEGDMARGIRKRSRGKEVKTSGLVMQSEGMTKSAHASASSSHMADEFSRASTYTQPRTITLNTKYQGVPVVCPYTGYAVMVVGADGTRRVVEGPFRILMEYDETLEVLSLSRGKPKNTDNRIYTVYLRTKNNKVSDQVTIETSDHVKVTLRMSFLCDFEGDNSKWFEVENYVKFMTDHIRSVLSGSAKQHTIAKLYLDAINFVRDSILGKKTEDGRKGMFFEECNLRIKDVEILSVNIQDASIADLLLGEQHAVVSQNIKLDHERRNLVFAKENESIKREITAENFETSKFASKIAIERAATELSVAMALLGNEIETQAKQAEINKGKAEAISVTHKAELARDAEKTEQRIAFAQKEQEQRIEFLMAQADAALKQVEKFGPEFTSALTTLSNNETAREVSQAFNVMSLAGGKNAAEVIQQALGAVPGVQKWLKGRSEAIPNGNGQPRVEHRPTT